MVLIPLFLLSLFIEMLYLAIQSSYGRSDTGFGVISGRHEVEIEYALECKGGGP